MEELIKTYEKRIFCFLLSYVKIQQEAEDLTQEVLIKLWQNRTRIKSVEDQEAYILAMTRNQIRDHFKKMQREAGFLNEVLEHFPIHGNDVLSQIRHNELVANIDIAVSELPDKQKQVYHLIYKQGKSLIEIAKEMEISPYTVKNHKIQALKSIRSRLRDFMELE